MPPNTENIVVIRKIFINSFFLDITIGIIITSGGTGKKELSIKDIKPKIGLENLCLANSTHLSYNFLIISNL